jgi:hypothetical protein
MFFAPERRRRCADASVPSMGTVGALSSGQPGEHAHGLNSVFALQSANSPTATPVTTPLAADCAGEDLVWV